LIGISKLYCGGAEASDAIRYARYPRPSHSAGAAPARKPVVVWNCTRRCNLRCAHCYSASGQTSGDDELSADQAGALIDDLAGFGVPVILFSGGEPLMRPDIFELIARAGAAGMRTVLSTNGTRIDRPAAERLAAAGVGYVGVSLDGLAETNDAFRGEPGAFEAATAGIGHCQAVGVPVGLRFTMHAGNVHEVPAIFDLAQRQGIGRVCFYHLVPTGRADGLADGTLTSDQTRGAMDVILDRTAALHAAGSRLQVLTVDNHADGPYVYLQMLRERAARAAECLELLSANGGNASGVGIGCVRWNGDVLADQFWTTHALGNVRRQPFGRIWSGETRAGQKLLAMLRDRRRHLPDRCRRCRWVEVCNGNLRARAEAATGDAWGDDPACYLREDEIAC